MEKIAFISYFIAMPKIMCYTHRLPVLHMGANASAISKLFMNCITV